MLAAANLRGTDLARADLIGASVKRADARSWFTPYYFSIVTYTTLGFGDVRPATLAGEIVVSSEVILGYTTLGVLLSVLAQTIARRS